MVLCTTAAARGSRPAVGWEPAPIAAPGLACETLELAASPRAPVFLIDGSYSQASLFKPMVTERLWHLAYQVLMAAVVNVSLLPNGSRIVISLVPQGMSSIPGLAYL